MGAFYPQPILSENLQIMDPSLEPTTLDMDIDMDMDLGPVEDEASQLVSFATSTTWIQII